MPRPDMASKLRQVDHFCEVLGHAVQDSPLASSRRLRVVDMGAGKGYLTFATHAFLSSGGGSGSMELTERQVETIGVEIRQVAAKLPLPLPLPSSPLPPRVP